MEFKVVDQILYVANIVRMPIFPDKTENPVSSSLFLCPECYTVMDTMYRLIS